MSAPRLLLVVLVGLAQAATVHAEEPSSCISCHFEEEEAELSAPVDEWRESTHARVEVSCDACHGGDPSETDEELSMSEDDAGFLGTPSWHEVPELCGSCHEDMLDGYNQSVMAAQIEKGERVAVCTSCHMTKGHAISRVEPREILTAEACGDCHDPQRAFDLLAVLESAGDMVASAEALVGELHGRIDTGRLDREISDIKSRYLVVAHTYDSERIMEVADASSVRIDALSEAVEDLGGELRFRRRLGGAVIVFVTLVCIGALKLESDLRRRQR